MTAHRGACFPYVLNYIEFHRNSMRCILHYNRFYIFHYYCRRFLVLNLDQLDDSS